jgi:hypothetical protein
VSAVYAALVHHPVRGRDGGMITSAITNIDVHDIARSAQTFGLRGYFLVSPIAAQRVVVDRILEHWRDGAGARRVPERTVALSTVQAVESIEAAVATITEREGQKPRIVVTEARPELGLPSRTFAEVRAALADGPPALLLFGTAHGLHESVLRTADLVIEPITGVGAYNHLSVRAAAAIVFDRLFGRG